MATDWDTFDFRTVAATSQHRQWCVTNNHPGVTFNPLEDRTWCACGEMHEAGDTATFAAIRACKEAVHP